MPPVRKEQKGDMTAERKRRKEKHVKQGRKEGEACEERKEGRAEKECRRERGKRRKLLISAMAFWPDNGAGDDKAVE